MRLPRRLLIANRGEIACRIIRTARRLGIETVAVYSDADARSLHVQLADQACRLGPAPALESYLNTEAVLAAARDSGADALHPGYGFLSENEVFAEACRAQGIVFVGPPPEAIRAMGSKSAAKALMQRAGVPVTPGYHGEAQDLATLQKEADRISYPLLIKATAGGGGRGLRRVNQADEFATALAACQREAASAFDDDRVLLERYIEQPRHIEIQVFADTFNQCIHLGERDCSVQRRHQKVIEEAPAPGLDAARRTAMGDAAIRAALAVGYVGAGTVEFIVAPDGQFFFMEMNTRLQVEHPVTEMITGLDLVEWQLRIAAGEPLPKHQQDIAFSGHAIEARVYAEDPSRNFIPSIGRITEWITPPSSDSLRIDTGFVREDTITPFYDALLAKVIVHGADREEACQRLRKALASLCIVGPTTNIEFLHALIDTPSFREARLDTALIERESETLAALNGPLPNDLWLYAAIAKTFHDIRQESSSSPWAATDGWRSTGSAQRRLILRCRDEQRQIEVRWIADGFEVRHADAESWIPSSAIRCHDGLLSITVGGRTQSLRALCDENDRLHLFVEGRQLVFAQGSDRATRADQNGTSITLRAPMPGRITAVHVKANHPVRRGSPLVTLEAMKMEHTLTAPSDGQVSAFSAEPDQQVAEGVELLRFERMTE